jgi:hypothetical protein
LPNVDHDTETPVTLRIIKSDVDQEDVSPNAHDVDPQRECTVTQQVSRERRLPTAPHLGNPSGAREFADRLNRLFDAVHPSDRGPYSDEEVAESLQDDGILLHPNSIARLRTGVGNPPDERTTQVLAFFFNVDSDYLRHGIGLTPPVLTPHQREDRDRSERMHAEPVGATQVDQPQALLEPTRPACTDIELSTADLLRLSTGLSQAALYASRRAYADRAAICRLVLLVADVGEFLSQSLEGRARVAVRFLERVIVEWDETSPADNGTESDYRWLAELLNRHLG